jgi:pimeloyl-ACP methyl ester carboxylesterase
VEAIRADPSVLKGLKLKTVVEHYARIISRIDPSPILIGHSFGGLIVQMLLDRGLGAAGVAIDSAQSAGVPVLPFSTIRSTLSILGNPFTLNGADSLSPEKFNYAFTNELNAEESKKVYDRYQIPGANRILWDGALALFNPRAASRVDYSNNNRAPLLFIAGGNDHLVPPAVNKANVRKYVKNSTAVTDYREFPNRTHYTVGQAGWEEVADFAMDWAKSHARGQVSLSDVTAAFTTTKTSAPPTTPPELRA